MSNTAIAVHASQPVTILGGKALRIPTAGKIRAGIKVLTRTAAGNSTAKGIYDKGLRDNLPFDEIAKMIKNGEDLRVIDNKTKNDITAITLTQLLFETEKKAKTQPSVDLLKEIIRHGDGSFSGYIGAKLTTELARFEEDAPSAAANAGAQTTLNQ